MRSEQQHYWFRARRYGYGWTPCTWQGWLVVGAFIVLFTGTVAGSIAAASVSGLLVALCAGASFLLVIALIYVCYATGEPARWRWGK
jgi:hypothetical protein